MKIDNHGQLITATDPDGKHIIYVPATHAGYTKDGTVNVNPVRMFV